MNKSKLDILIEQEVKLPKLTEEQIAFLDRHIQGTWEYKNGLVNVRGGFQMHNETIALLPVQFGAVNGRFFINGNKLTSLKGCPHFVGQFFYCESNKLTSLEYMPTHVGDTFDCCNNPFILNDKLFEDLAKIGKDKLFQCAFLLEQLKDKIHDQFGITDKEVIHEIWKSYMKIFNRKNNG